MTYGSLPLHPPVPLSPASPTPSTSRGVAGTRPLGVLLLEADATDATLVERVLADLRRDVVVRRVETGDAFERGLRETSPDALLVDFHVAHTWPTGLFVRLRMLRPAAPFIALVRALDEYTVSALLRVKPDDVVVKSNAERLVAAIERGIAARRLLSELSPRQLEVLIQVAEGRSTREIAEQRGLSVKTVESHRGAMMKRLGLHDVAGLVRLAMHMGLVQADA